MPSSSKTYLSVLIVSVNKFVTCQLACVGAFQQVYVGDSGRIGKASSQGKLLRHLGHLRLLCVKSTLSSSKPRPENMFCEGICDIRSIYVGGGDRIRITSSRRKLLRRLTHLRLLCGQGMLTSSKPYPENSILRIFSAIKFVTCQLACVVTCQTV